MIGAGNIERELASQRALAPDSGAGGGAPTAEPPTQEAPKEPKIPPFVLYIDALFPKKETPFITIADLEADPDARNRKEMVTLKTRILRLIESDPRANASDREQAAGLLARLEIMLVGMPPEEAVFRNLPTADVVRTPGAVNTREAEIADEGRNSCEKWLLRQGFPKERIREATPEAFALKRSWLLTYGLRLAVSQDGNWAERIFSDPSEIRSVAGVKGEVASSMKELSQTMSDGIDDLDERTLAQNQQEQARLEWDALSAIFTGFAKYREGAFNIEGFLSYFDNTKRKTPASYLDGWFFDTLDKMPPLLKEPGKLAPGVKYELDDRLFGQRILLAFKKIVNDGHVTLRDRRALQASVRSVDIPAINRERAAEDPPRPPLTPAEEREFLGKFDIVNDFKSIFLESTKSDERNKAARVWVKGVAGHGWRKLRSFLRGGKAIFPYESTTDPDLQEKVMDVRKFASHDATGFSSYSDIPAEKTASGDAATAAAILLAETTLEGMAQDNKDHRPMGVQIAPRMMQAWQYAIKVISQLSPGEEGDGASSAEGATNQFIVGRVNQFFTSYFEHLCYDGKTLLQHLMDPANAKWTAYTDRDGVKHGIDFSRLPSNPTYSWHNHVTRAAQLWNIVNGGLQVGDITSVAQLKLEEGEVVINRKAVTELLTVFRTLMQYHVKTDNVPTAVTKKRPRPAGAQALTKEQERLREKKELSEDFISLEVYDMHGYDGVRLPVPSTTLTTRIFSMYPTAPETDLARWVQGARAGTDVIVEVEPDFLVDARGAQIRNPNAGKKTKTMRIFLYPDPSHQFNDERRERKEFVARNSAEILTARMLVSRYLEMVTLPGDAARRLNKQDYLPLGFFFSREIRENFLKGGLRGVNEKLRQKIGDFFNWSILKTEDFGVIGPDLYTQEQFFQVLAGVNLQISVDDLKKFAEGIGETFGIPTK